MAIAVWNNQGCTVTIAATVTRTDIDHFEMLMHTLTDVQDPLGREEPQEAVTAATERVQGDQGRR